MYIKAYWYPYLKISKFSLLGSEKMANNNYNFNNFFKIYKQIRLTSETKYGIDSDLCHTISFLSK
mgnify:CR=1 FL=1